ncbi:hypothetical protein AB0H43_04560 [Hamadaea sp. NPDC050747]|uniref:hypothetical protein n=1 Tax=Hamadaea sp. NPDC050747 TaxID=3155789 RepID=UPI0033C3AE76
MIEVPSQQTARDAWAALPEPVRCDARRQAERGAAATGPAVAAVIPWPDVLRLSLVGPSPGGERATPALVWTLRDRAEIRLELGVLGVPPEQIVLAARAYKLAR